MTRRPLDCDLPEPGTPPIELFDGVAGVLPRRILRDARTLPDRLSEELRRIEIRGSSSVSLCRAIASNLPERFETLGESLIDVAIAADRSGLVNAYHNPAHSRDVGVVFLNLVRLHALIARFGARQTAEDILIGCCAAFGHDIGHDGRSDDDTPPFRLERIAADTVGGIMRRHGVPAALIERARCVILMTNTTYGYPVLEALRDGRPMPPIARPDASMRVLQDRSARALAFMLRDADVLQSAGLSAEDHDRQTARLERERDMPVHGMGARGTDYFLRDILRGHFLSESGSVFQPRLDNLMALNSVRATAARAPEGLASFEQSLPN